LQGVGNGQLAVGRLNQHHVLHQLCDCHR
jgi:hypothetical protein